MSSTAAGALATFFGAAFWGLIWLPVLQLDNLGVSGMWTIVLIQPAAALAAFLVILLKKELNSLRQVNNWLVGGIMGISSVLYFAGILLADVVRVIFLFYTLPVWTIVWNATIYRIAPSPRHYVVISIALIGLWMFLTGGNSWVPKPESLGDWCGILAGALWGLGLTLLQHKRNITPNATSFTAFAVAFLIALLVALLTINAPFNATTDGWFITGLPIAVLVGVGMQFPVMFAMVWGGQRLTAPTAALLTMSEILAATLSASWILGNKLNAVAWVGGIVIVVAALVDIISDMRSARVTRNKQ